MEANWQNLATKEELKATKEELLQKMQQLATREELSEVKQDVSVLKEDVSVLKEDVSILKKDVSDLKQGQALLSKKVDKNSENISTLITEVVDIKEYLREKVVTNDRFDETFGRLLTGQDHIVKMIETIHLEMKAQDVTTARMKKNMAKEEQRNDTQDKILDKHDSRIAKFETNAA